MATGAAVDSLEAARSWIETAAELPDESLTCWTSTVGGVPVRLRCTDPAVAQLYRARMLGGEPDAFPVMRLDLLETESLGWTPPDHVVDLHTDPSERARRFADARLGALMPSAESDGRYPWVFFDPVAQRGVMLVRTVADQPLWTAGAPFVLLLHLAFAWRGWRLMHAATLGALADGALLVGPGGSGKSATTLAGLAGGLQTVGDDYVVVTPGRTPVAWPLYRILKLDRAGLSRARRDDLAVRPLNWNGKVELDLETDVGSRPVDRLGLRLILLPTVTGARRTQVQSAAPTEAFSAAASSMLAQLPGARVAGFSFLTRLTRTLPACHLRLSEDPQEIAATVRRLLES